MAQAILTEEAAKMATPASQEVANQIVEEGLAKHPEDVVVDKGNVFSRAYLPDGNKAAFYLKVGSLVI